jgi:rhodanese-related sulfurtransferase
MRSLAVYLSLGSLYLRPVQAEDMRNILQLVRERFPSVPQLSTEQLANWLADSNRTPPLLIDVREPKEFAVSQLRHATNLTSAAAIRQAAPAKAQPVVLYCSVGYRSSAIAAQLIKTGYTQVWNLEGSIFAWANEQRPVFRRAEPVHEVHPYDPKWGALLDATWHPRLVAPPTTPATPPGKPR